MDRGAPWISVVHGSPLSTDPRWRWLAVVHGSPLAMARRCPVDRPLRWIGEGLLQACLYANDSKSKGPDLRPDLLYNPTLTQNFA